MIRLLLASKSYLRRSADSGATAVEYGLFLALIAAVIVGAVTALGGGGGGGVMGLFQRAVWW